MNKMIKYNEELNIIGKKVREYRKVEKISLSQLSNKLLLLGVVYKISKQGKEW